MTSSHPAVVQVKVLFFGGEAWQDRRVVRWSRRGHPIVMESGSEWIVTPGEWR